MEKKTLMLHKSVQYIRPTIYLDDGQRVSKAPSLYQSKKLYIVANEANNLTAAGKSNSTAARNLVYFVQYLVVVDLQMYTTLLI